MPVKHVDEQGVKLGIWLTNIEVHPNPCEALSDANQQLTPGAFDDLMKDINSTLTFRDGLAL